MTKQCKDCKEIKAIEGFYSSKTHLDGKMSYCKQCHKKRAYKWRKNNLEKFNKSQLACYYKKQDLRKKQSREYHNKTKKSFYSVYLLPEEYYVGITNNLPRRLREHKHVKRNVNGYRVLSNIKDLKTAMELEDLLHDMGYKGRNESRFDFYRPSQQSI